MNQPRMRRLLPPLIGVVILTLGLLGPLAPSARVYADHTPNPTSVTIAGSLQDELGCPGDWQPECAATHLTDDASDDVWQAVFSIPAGSWEYKAALNDNWDENYGLNAQQDGPNIPLSLAAGADVNAQDVEGKTPLMKAASANRIGAAVS